MNTKHFKNLKLSLTKEWNLPADILVNAESYFLMHLTAHEIDDILTNAGITVKISSGDEVTFTPCFNKRAIPAYNEELLSKECAEKFWLSFRSVRYSEELHSYVLIQLDTSKRN
jgi:hypothetical protein